MEHITILPECVEIIKRIDETLERIEKKICFHIEEGEKTGGFRDRVLKLEMDFKEMKNRFWASALIGGIIGALIGSGSGDVLRIFLGWIMKR